MKLNFEWADLSRLGGVDPAEGTGGELRRVPADFVVEELPAYLPSGEGEHLMVQLRKVDHTTAHVVRELARQLGVKDRHIGVAGLKDRHAVTTQWLSLPAKAERRLDRFALDGAEILQARRHPHRLGVGHLRGNRFSVRVRGADMAQVPSAQQQLTRLAQDGIPNYFGPQRFGLGGLNAEEGLRVLRGESALRDPRLRRFLVSALQSAAFNAFLSLRLERDLFGRVVHGDMAKKHDTGGVFEVEDAEAESRRAQRGEISATGTLHGRKTRRLTADAGALEDEALAQLGLEAGLFTLLRGDRRLTRVYFLEEPRLEVLEDGYRVTFALPKGSFATSVLRELMGGEVDQSQLPTEALPEGGPGFGGPAAEQGEAAAEQGA